MVRFPTVGLCEALLHWLNVDNMEFIILINSVLDLHAVAGIHSIPHTIQFLQHKVVTSITTHLQRCSGIDGKCEIITGRWHDLEVHISGRKNATVEQ